MKEIGTFLYTLGLIGCASLLSSFLCPDEKEKGWMRYLIGLITAAALLSPLVALTGTDLGMLAEGNGAETGEGAVSLYLTYQLKKAAEGTERRLEKEFSLSEGTLRLTLYPDGSELSAVKIVGADLVFKQKTDRFVREAVIKRAEELLECPVNGNE